MQILFGFDLGGYFQFSCPERGGMAELSNIVIVGETHRMGCDDMPSSLMNTDSCGVCGGSDDCIDCNGTPDGSK